jgi:WD40 repeat protein
VYANHRVAGSGPFAGGSPYIRGLDLLSNTSYWRYGYGQDAVVAGIVTINQVFVSPNGDYLMGLTTLTAYNYRGDTLAALPTFDLFSGVPANEGTGCRRAAIRISPDRQYLYVPGGAVFAGTPLNFIKVPELVMVNGLFNSNNGTSASGNGCWSVDGTMFAHAHSTGSRVSVFSWPAFVRISLPALSTGVVQEDVAFNTAGTLLATISPGTVTVWDIAGNGSTLFTMAFGGHRIELTPDGLYWMVANTLTGTIGFIDTTTFELVALPITSPLVLTQEVKFSSDMKYLIVCVSPQTTVYEWSTKTILPVQNTAVSAALYGMDIGPIGHSISNTGGLPVRDLAGNPIEGVWVTANAVNGGHTQSYASTGSDGRYVIPCATTLPKTVIFKGVQPGESSTLVDWVTPV